MPAPLFTHSTRRRLAFVAGLLTASLFSGEALAQAQGAGQANKPPPSISEKTSEAFQKLRPLQEKQPPDYNAMLAVLNAVQYAPNSYDEAIVLDMKAKLLAMQNQYAKAIEPWERAIQLSDQNGFFPEKQTLETVLLLAQLHGSEGSTSKVPAQQKQHFEKATAHFKRFFEKTKKPTPENLMAYASILYYKAVSDQNNVDQAAIAEVKKIIERGLLASNKPKPEFYQLLLTVLQQQNDMAGSAEIIELLLKQAPEKKDFWPVLMGSYLQLSEKASKTDAVVSKEYLIRAIITCERAQAQGYMKTAKDNLNLVSLYLMAGQLTKGTEILYNGMKAGQIDSEPTNWRLLGRYYQEANLHDKAVAALTEAASIFPKNGEIELQIAHIYIQLEKNAEAFKHLRKAIEKGSLEKPFSVYYLLAYTAYDLGEVEEAHKAVELASKYPEAAKDPQFPRLKTTIAEAYTERELKKAEKAKLEGGSKK